MTYLQRRKAEIAAHRAVKPRKQPVRRSRPIRIPRTDADSLRFIASRIGEAGMKNFAAELERIAAAAVVDDVPAQGAVRE